MDIHLRAIKLPQELIECVFKLRLNTKKNQHEAKRNLNLCSISSFIKYCVPLHLRSVLVILFKPVLKEETVIIACNIIFNFKAKPPKMIKNLSRASIELGADASLLARIFFI